MGLSIPRAPRRSNAVRLVLVVLAVVGIGTLTTGCGQSSSAASSSITTSTTSTTTTTTTTTATPRPDADRKTVLVAAAATLHATDFPEAWTELREPTVRHLGPDSCSYVADGPETTLLTGAAQTGPTMQLGDRPGYITSSSYVFADTELADEWLATVRSDEWATCRSDRIQALQDADEPGVTFEVHSRQNEQLGRNGFEAFTEFRGYDAEGFVVASVAVLHYRMRRVVIEDALERSVELDDHEWEAVDNDHHTALVRMWDRLNRSNPND